VLETQGPYELEPGPTPTQPALLTRLVERTQIDGLGRPVKRRRGTENTNVSTVRDVFTATYVDSGARSVTAKTLFDETGGTPRWRTDVAKLDALGRVIREEEPAAVGTRVTTREYDSSGLLVKVTVPDPQTGAARAYTLAYDGLGRIVRASSPLDSPIDTTYTGLSTVIEQKADAALARRKQVDTDSFGRVTAVTEGVTNRATALYTYDAVDRVAKIVDADGIATDLAYDMRGLRTQITRGQTTLRYGYDLDGNRTSLIHPTVGAYDPAKDVSRWTYDPLDRLATSTPALRDWTSAIAKRYGPDGTSEQRATTYTYDEPDHGFGTGRLTRVETPVLTTSFHYTPEGQVSKEKRTWSIAPLGVVWSHTSEQTATYGPTGNVLTVAHPDGQTTSRWSYDDRGRDARVDVTGGITTFASLTRNASGFLTQRNTPVTNLRQTWTRDAEGRVTASEIKGTWGCSPSTSCPFTTIAGETLVFDALGDVFSVLDRGRGDLLRFAYDERDQLIAANTHGNSHYVATLQYSTAGKLSKAKVTSDLPDAGVTNRDVSYDYARRGSTDTADPDAVRALRDVLSNAEIATLVYDASGNLKSKTAPGSSDTFTYDGHDRLREAVNGAGCSEIYYYDHSGDRALTHRTGCGTAATVRHHFGGTELFHTAPGVVSKSTVDVAFARSPVLRVTRAAGSSATVEHLFHGVLGSLLATTNTAGQGTSRFGYGAFGEVLYAEGPEAAKFDHRFNGKADDAATKLRYYGARYYDPLTLTWTQADPLYRFLPEAGLLEPRRMSLYMFSLNNPVRFVDPDGRSVGGVLGGIAAGAAEGVRTVVKKAAAAAGGELLAWMTGLGVVEGVAVGAAVGLVALVFVIPRAENEVPLNCGDYNHHCWQKYTERLVAANQKVEAAKAARREAIRARAQELAKPAGTRIHLFRGVTQLHEGYENATRGIAVPIGGHDDPHLHNGGDTESIFTSWTTLEHVAEDFALKSGQGVVLDSWFTKSRLVPSPDEHTEGEILVVGPVTGAGVRVVPEGSDQW
jgi:RHS repeat-associated protein